jgi:hypothetical protein
MSILRYRQICEGGYPITEAPCDICGGRRAEQSCGRPLPDPRVAEILSLRAEIERLREDRDRKLMDMARSYNAEIEAMKAELHLAKSLRREER